MATTDYSKMTPDQLQAEGAEIFKTIVEKLDAAQWMEISELVQKFGTARFYHGANLMQNLMQ